VNQLLKDGVHRSQIRDSHCNVLEPLPGDRASTYPVNTIIESEQRRDIREREAKRLSPTNKQNSLDEIVGIYTISTQRLGWRAKQLAALVIANRLDPYASLTGEGSYSK